jgi:23S rRNA pseudouridine955/2504/2580 synthase
MLSALYEDDEILVIDKPPGLPSQPGEGVRVSVVEAVERDFGFRPFLVHRLDKETAGCLVVARDARAASKWSRLLESRELGKTYRAIVSGIPEGREGRFSDPVPTKGGAKAASTSWRLLGSFGGVKAGASAAVPGADAGGPGSLSSSRNAAPRFSYLELELGTGRMHQIRIHLAGHGLPILGDDRHGDFALNKALRKEAGLKRLLLVAWSLALPGGPLVRAALPEHFAAFIARFPDAPAPGPAPGASASPGGGGAAP